MDRAVVAVDTFPLTIRPSVWANGVGALEDMQWISASLLKKVNTTGFSALTRIGETYNAIQWSTTVVETHTNNQDNWFGSFVRGNASNAEMYFGLVQGLNASVKYAIYEADSAGSLTQLASGGTGAGVAAGSSTTIEAEGTALRQYTTEGSGAETLQLSTTDATISTGLPGPIARALTSIDHVSIRSWSGGGAGPSIASRNRFGKQITLRPRPFAPGNAR